MKQIFTYNETRLLILIVILSLLRGAYNLYIIYTTDHEKIDSILSSSKKLSDKVKDFSFFSIVQLLISVLYLFSSVYFFVNDKIKNVVFALVCLYMFIRSLLYFMIRFLGHIPFIPDNVEAKYVYDSFRLANLLLFSASFYFIKVIFLG
jgi:DMSO reductase anchor subunit